MVQGFNIANNIAGMWGPGRIETNRCLSNAFIYDLSLSNKLLSRVRCRSPYKIRFIVCMREQKTLTKETSNDNPIQFYTIKM